MDIPSVSISPPASSSASPLAGNAVAPFADGPKPGTDKQASAVVSLSAQGQQLSQAQTNQPQTSQSQPSNGANTAAAENVEPQSQKTAEPPGIQSVQGESKDGRIDTYA